jgi:hexosaminidase
MLALIPKPAKITIQQGSFTINPDTRVIATTECSEIASHVTRLIGKMPGFRGIIETIDGDHAGETNCISIGLLPDETTMPAEGYELAVTRDAIHVRGKDLAGCFYGVQTLRQLLPALLEDPLPADDQQVSVPCVTISDHPRFSWRGFMLDECRHFFGKLLVKRMLDLMALHKLNKFHWHLTEDEGWRIESARYPRLHEIGSTRVVSKRFHETPSGDDPLWYRGYYTVADLEDVFAYAKQRYIDIIPEIEMPGHATAALVAYPEHSCSTPPAIVPVVEQGNRHAFCAGNPETYAFLQDVLDEVIAIFDKVGCDKIHIGGDELPAERWQACPRCNAFMKQVAIPDLDQLQVHFAAQIIKHLNSRNKTAMGWFDFPVDRLLDHGIDKDKLIFQFWVGSEKKMLDFIRKGGKCVVSNHKYVYLDYAYWTTPLKKAYMFDPIPEELEPEYRPNVLGIEPPIWTERVASWQRMDYQVFPRLCAYAETAWSPAGQKNYPDFMGRLQEFLKRLDHLRVYYAPIGDATNSLKYRLLPRAFRECP